MDDDAHPQTPILPHYRFSRDWYRYSHDEITLVLDAMRDNTRLTHEEHHRLTMGRQRPPAADRSLLLAVLADVVTYHWDLIERLQTEVRTLTATVTRLQHGPPTEETDPDDDYTGDPHAAGSFESPSGPA